MFFFICLVEFHCEAIWSWTFVYMEFFFNYRFYFTSSDWSVQINYFFFVFGFFFYKFIYLFIYLWLRWVFIAVCSFLQLQHASFSLWWLLLLWSMGSRHTGFSSCGSWAVERKFSSCGTWAHLLCSMWDLPRPGLKPVSAALAGRFLTTAPPGKPKSSISS